MGEQQPPPQGPATTQMDDGEYVGDIVYVGAVEIAPENLRVELLAVGNVGTFFEDN